MNAKLQAMSRSREDILADIDALKREKPIRWQLKVRGLCNVLARSEGINDRIHPREIPEAVGRHAWKRQSAPMHDEYGDNSFP